MTRAATVLLICASACARPASPSAPAPSPEIAMTSPHPRIAPQRARELVNAGALLLDVRTPQEFAQGHLDGAVNIPFDELAARLTEIGAKDRQVVVYCHSGRRSALARQTLSDAGYPYVYDLGPMTAWPQ